MGRRNELGRGWLVGCGGVGWSGELILSGELVEVRGDWVGGEGRLLRHLRCLAMGGPGTTSKKSFCFKGTLKNRERIRLLFNRDIRFLRALRGNKLMAVILR